MEIGQMIGIIIFILLFALIITAVIKFISKKKKEVKEVEEKEENKIEEETAIPEEVPAPVIEEGATIRDGLVKTRNEGFIGKLMGLFKGKEIDENLLEKIEEILFTADIGVNTSQKLINSIKEGLSKKELSNESLVWDRLKKEMGKIFADCKGGFSENFFNNKPVVIMVVGVNGSGKTTTIGKLAHMMVNQGKRVLLAAGDTFRAAAREQLHIWADRSSADIFEGKEGQDPASVVFDALKNSLEKKYDVVIVDTAGRLHTRANLIEELKKIKRVIERAIPSAPHDVLLVLDATTGQNGLKQAEVFLDATQVSGITLAKLDGTAKGGIVLGIYDGLKIPVRFVGVGEKLEDLLPFDPAEYIDGLFE